MTQDHTETPRDWDRPGAHPVAPGVFRIPLPMPGFGLEHITDVLVTHAHRDHYTLAVIIRRKWGARVSIGAAERASIEELTVRTEWEPPRQVAMLHQAGASELAEAMLAAETPFDNSVWAPPDRWLADGSLITLRADPGPAGARRLPDLAGAAAPAAGRAAAACPRTRQSPRARPGGPAARAPRPAARGRH